MPSYPTVFVSHSHKDNAFGLRLIADLRARLGDENVWYDVSDGLHGGDEWWREIVRQITARDVFLVILSPNALASPYVQREMAMAYQLHLTRNKRLLPIRYQPCELEIDWEIIHWLPCHDPQIDAQGYAQDVEAILADLLRMPASGQQPPAQPTPTLAHITPQVVTVAPPSLPTHDWDGIAIHGRLYDLGFRGWQVRRTGVEFILPSTCDVTAGSFLMGSADSDINADSNEKPQYRIPVNAYTIGKYPVTVAEYQCYLNANPSVTVPPGDDDDPDGWKQQQRHPDHPVDNIMWVNAQDYTMWLAQITGQLWRLPTEAEWEKAARWDKAGQADPCARIFPWGNQWDKTRANAGEGSVEHITPVGNYPSGASPYGAQDMAGNVWEWCSSLYKARYPYDPKACEDVENRTDDRVIRGSMWNEPPERARAASRTGGNPTDWRSSTAGFRLARS